MKTQVLQPSDESMQTCAAYLQSGGVVAFPTETVYGLGADALNEQAVREIYRVKGRPSDNPLIVHVYEMRQIEEIARDISPLARTLMQKFMPGALTLVLKKNANVPDCVTGGLDTVGVRMPNHAVCRSFLQACNRPVCAPSANTSTLPSPTAAEHVYRDLQGKIPYILDGGACEIGVESTILDVSNDVPRLLRAGGISRETLEQACGCRIETNVKSGVALCPGMKYKHYAPRAEVFFSAYYADMDAEIRRHYDAYAHAGKRPVILCLHSNISKYATRSTYDMGEDYRGYAHNLFGSLRRADDENFDIVLAEGVPGEDVGEAIINR
ncbi:MAG: threonylcarbamoyl-AMP synthase, partial [Clostridiales bacterium]|nr:threonylcarbamoyl-AMP synthase [Clostridiales bacterium]